MKIEEQLCDSSVKAYRQQLIDHHPEMESHVIRANDCSHWEKCWSSLWVYDFLLRWWIANKHKERENGKERKRNSKQTVKSRLEFITNNLNQVFRPLSSAITADKEEFRLLKGESANVHCLYDHHCNIVGLWHPQMKMDSRETFRHKVLDAQRIVHHLSKGCGLSDLNRKIELMDPYLTKLTRDELSGVNFAIWLTEDVVQSVCKSPQGRQESKTFRPKK